MDSESRLKAPFPRYPRGSAELTQSLASSCPGSDLPGAPAGLIKSLFGFCVRMRDLPVNPAAELALPSYENRRAERVLAEEDLRRMLAAETEPRNRVLLRLLYVAGLRVSGACQLL